MPQENATDARAKVRCPADRECVYVERSLLKPGGVVGDERERAETDLAALHRNSAENHRAIAPQWAPTVVVLSRQMS